MFKEYLNDFFHLLFPEKCRTCSNVLIDNESEVCINCEIDLFPTAFKHQEELEIRKRFPDQSLFERVYTFARYEKGNKAQLLIHALKYNNNIKLGELVGDNIGHYLQFNDLAKEFDVLVPIPLHKKKLIKRGFNQSHQIALGIQQKIKKQIIHDEILIRTKEGSVQAKKNRTQRVDDLSSVFDVNFNAKYRDKHLLLIDDVMTTGATLNVCASQLKSAGYQKVSILSFAFA